jgi:uncharacterized repeat protein (TIGR03803 family)
MIKFTWCTKACGIFLLWAATAVALSAQTFTTLHNFDGADGGKPYAAPIQATNGDLYGTTSQGGAHGNGTIFKITPGGALTTLDSFDGTDGADPYVGLVQGTDGNFYGTTFYGGANSCGGIGCGTVFKITPGGTLTTLLSFDSTDGANPYAGLVLAPNGNFYGTTEFGGAYSGGTVFKITPSGTLTTLYNFCSQDGNSCRDGTYVQAGLVQGTDGNIYGTTVFGGKANSCVGFGYLGCGTVFKITPGGTLTILHDFDKTDGNYPAGTLVQGADGDFYGTTLGGGANCVPYGCGTVFKITPKGTLTTLHSFDGTDGIEPEAGLVQATNGNFYGTTSWGGTNPGGTIFKITPGGNLTTLYNFGHGGHGNQPSMDLAQATNGTFYGTTQYGGPNADCYMDSTCGTVFILSVGLGPFVETQPTSGAVGTAVTILGTNLTGATSVAFSGTAATFTVVSASEITTTVPTSATTGTVQVVTPRGTLSSNVPFRVE